MKLTDANGIEHEMSDDLAIAIDRWGGNPADWIGHEAEAQEKIAELRAALRDLSEEASPEAERSAWEAREALAHPTRS